MSQDGRLQRIQRIVTNDRPNDHEIACPCGGTLYAAARTKFVTCSNKEYRCTICMREARRFGKAYTCGVGCKPPETA